MFIKSISIAILSLASVSFAGTCTNDGAERCLQANGLGRAYAKCESGNQVVYNCDASESCYGNGYEGSMNLFLEGINGNANSLNQFITNARTSLFTDPNAITQFSNAFSGGIANNKQRLVTGYTSTLNQLSSSTGQNQVISAARKFMGAASQNNNGLGFLATDLATNSLKSKDNLSGFASLITTGIKSTTPNASQDSAAIADTQRALSNLNLVLNMYYPTTLGKVFTGNFAPKSLATNLRMATNGNVNATSSALGTLLGGINGYQQYTSGFVGGALTASNTMSANVNTAILNRIFAAYKPRTQSTSTVTNFINGAANAVAVMKNRAAGPITSAFSLFRSNIPNNCGCTDTPTYNNFMLIGVLVILSSLVTPASSCCYPNTVQLAIRSLVV
ncbi:hypothetical protein BB559_005562 [Furculomyces boomerangus]|uniref:Uncharacterized protein n=1 Tax=Furculomyces boomerangus TaxID=61424 RepID=A0A2T9Y7Z6_9FUNG|nr:hypothetical protein BB559_005562 [Furculomyces boomerangus]